MKTRTLLAAIALGFLALLIIGCGGPSLMDALTSDDSGDTGGETEPPAEPAAEPAIQIHDDTDTALVYDALIDYGTAGPWPGYVDKTYEIVNAGDATLQLATIEAERVVVSAGSDCFSVTLRPDGDAILPSNRRSFIVRFETDYSFTNPEATISIDSNDPDMSTFQFRVTGYAGC